MTEQTSEHLKREMVQPNLQVFWKLGIARQKILNAAMKKTGKNTYSGYDYFQLDDFLPTVLKVFAELGLTGVVSYTAELATLTIVDLEAGGQILITSPMGSANLKGCHEVQNVGAVETYQRRYLWVTALEILEHDPVDATTGKDKDEPLKRIAPAQIKELENLIKKSESDKEAMLAYVKVNSIEELTPPVFEALKIKLNQKIRDAAESIKEAA